MHPHHSSFSWPGIPPTAPRRYALQYASVESHAWPHSLTGSVATGDRRYERFLMLARHYRYLVRVSLLTIVYFGAGKLGLEFALIQENVTLLWAPTGIALAALLCFGYRIWPALVLGAFLINASTSAPLGVAFATAVGNPLEALAGVYLLWRLVGFHAELDRLQDVLGFVGLAVVVSTIISATIGVTSLWLAHEISGVMYGQVWVEWWLGDAMGALLVTPVLLTWWAQPHVRWEPRRIAEATALGIALVVASVLAFNRQFSPAMAHSPLAFIVFPFLIWAALRFGQRGAATAT